MSTALFNYFSIRCEPPCPANQNVPILPVEIFSTITQFLDSSEVNLKTVVSWGLVCKFFLAECIRSCSNFRTYCLFRQINTFTITQKREQALDQAYTKRDNRKLESDGTLIMYNPSLFTFEVLNLKSSTRSFNQSLISDVADTNGHSSLFPISGAFKIANKIILAVWGRVFFYIQSPDGELSFERTVETPGNEIGILNESLYLVTHRGYFKMSLKEKDFLPCPADIQLAALQNPRFITTDDHLFIHEKNSTLLIEVAFDEEKGLQVMDKCLLPAPIHGWPKPYVHKNWFAFATVERKIYLMDLHTQEVIIGRDGPRSFPLWEGDSLIIRDDFLYWHSVIPDRQLWMHLPSRKDITDSVGPFFTPLLEQKRRWLIDFAILYDRKGRVSKIRLLVGSEELHDPTKRKTSIVEIELNTEQKKDVPPPSHTSRHSAQKTYAVAAALFLLMGLGGAALFQALHFNPSIQISRDLFISLPAIAALTMGFAGSIVLLAFRRYLTEKPHLLRP